MVRKYLLHNQIMNKFFQLTVDFPYLFIFGTLLATLFFALQLPKLRIEVDTGVYLPDDHPARIYDDLVEQVFNYQESIVIAVVNEGKDGVFNPQTLGKIKRLTEAISEAPYVIAQREEDVKSISTLDNIVGTEYGIEVTPLMENVPTTRWEIDKLRENLYGNEMFPGWLVSKDGTMAAILAKIDTDNDTEFRAYASIKEIVKREQGGGERIYIAGGPVLDATFVEYVVKNVRVTLPIVTGVIIVLLYFTYGSLRGVVLPLMVVFASVVWCLGIMSTVDVPFYDITSVTPVVLIAMGCADAIHILNRYYEEVRTGTWRSKKEIVVRTMLSIWPPIVITSITTAVGFASLCTSHLIPIWGFGMFTAVGILCALLFSLTFIPAGLMLVRVPDFNSIPKRGFHIGDMVQAYSEGLLSFLGHNVHRWRKITVTCGVIVAFAALIGFAMVQVNDSFMGMFGYKSEVYQSNKLIAEKMNGTVSLNVVVEGREADLIKDPSVLRRIAGLQAIVEEEKIVGGTISIADYIKRMNKVMNENKEEFNTIPDSREAVAQYLLLYSLSGDPDDFDEVVDYDYRQANIIVMLKDDHTAVMRKVANKVLKYAKQEFRDEPVDVNLAGYGHIAQVIIDLSVRGLLQSTILSIVVIYITTAIMFRSLTGGIYSIIPITLAMLINFGLMGTFGISIGFTNSVAFAVAMGVGVDYAIHFIFRFQRETAMHSNLADVSVATFKTSGKAISYNAIVVTAGFLVLLASSFTAQRDLGLLLSLSMVTSFIGSVTLLPASLCLFKPKFVFPRKREPVWWFAKVDSRERTLVEASDQSKSNDS